MPSRYTHEWEGERREGRGTIKHPEERIHLMSLSSAWKWRAVTLGQEENTWKVISKVFLLVPMFTLCCIHGHDANSERANVLLASLRKHFAAPSEIEGWTGIQLGASLYRCLVSTARMGYATRRLDFFFQPVRAISLGFQWT